MYCNGDCENHSGVVNTVIVKMTGNPFDGMKFNYCESAIKQDQRRGFIVEILK